MRAPDEHPYRRGGRAGRCCNSMAVDSKSGRILRGRTPGELRTGVAVRSR